MPKGEQVLSTGLPDKPDGFRIALDTLHKRADIVLQRPPLNVVTMPQREQLRQTFEALAVSYTHLTLPTICSV